MWFLGHKFKSLGLVSSACIHRICLANPGSFLLTHFVLFDSVEKNVCNMNVSRGLISKLREYNMPNGSASTTTIMKQNLSLEPTFTLVETRVCLEIVPMETTGEICGFLIVWNFKIFGPLAVKF